MFVDCRNVPAAIGSDGFVLEKKTLNLSFSGSFWVC
jgi:hypothetical protein